MKSNPTPTDYVDLCTKEQVKQLIHLNVHLRANGVDARHASTPGISMIRVPPKGRVKAKKLMDAWLKEPTSLQDDYAKLKGRLGA